MPRVSKLTGLSIAAIATLFLTTASVNALDLTSLETCLKTIQTVEDQAVAASLEVKVFTNIARHLSSAERHCAGKDYAAAKDEIDVARKLISDNIK